MLGMAPPAAWWLLAFAALGGLWGLIWLRRQAAAGTTSAAADGPVGWTTAEWLEDLVTRGWLAPAKAGAFHARLASIVRAHLEATRGVPAARMTTPEAVAAVAELGGPAESQLVARVLAACDAVKFANEPAGEAEMAGVLAEARALVAAQGNPVLGAVGPGATYGAEGTP